MCLQGDPLIQTPATSRDLVLGRSGCSRRKFDPESSSWQLAVPAPAQCVERAARAVPQLISDEKRSDMSLGAFIQQISKEI